MPTNPRQNKPATSRTDILLLYRRAGFGGSPGEIDLGTAAGFDATVDRLVEGLSQPDAAHPGVPHLTTYPELEHGRRADTYDEYLGLIGWWLDKMAATTTPLREKLVLLLHGQFPTGFTKVGIPVFMHRQNDIFRRLGPGAFDELTLALAKDPAMLVWLDADSDVRSAPNENFARELMERFTMGVGHYSQRDVEEAARAFSGWSVSSVSGKFTQNEWAHDFGDKVFLGKHGDLSGDDIVDIVTHTPASARWIVSRMWSWLAFPIGPRHPITAELVPGYATDLNITNLMKAILLHPQFRSSASTSGLIKQPIEWMVGIMRALRVRAKTFHKSGGAGYLRWILSNLGQVPFDPPSVGGWGSNTYWLSTAASLTRLNFAKTVANLADLSAVDDYAGGERVESVGSILGIDSWTNESHAALFRVHHDPVKLVTLALTAPEVVAN